MRAAAAFLVFLGTGIGLRVLAEEPPPAAPPPTAAAPPAQTAAPLSAPDPSAASSAPAASASASPASGSVSSGSTAPAKPTVGPVTVTADAVSPEDKELMARGYKIEMRHGEKYFCRRESQIGSRFEVKTCNTALAIRAERESGEEALRRMQTDRPTVNH